MRQHHVLSRASSSASNRHEEKGAAARVRRLRSDAWLSRPRRRLHRVGTEVVRSANLHSLRLARLKKEVELGPDGERRCTSPRAARLHLEVRLGLVTRTCASAPPPPARGRRRSRTSRPPLSQRCCESSSTRQRTRSREKTGRISWMPWPGRSAPRPSNLGHSPRAQERHGRRSARLRRSRPGPAAQRCDDAASHAADAASQAADAAPRAPRRDLGLRHAPAQTVRSRIRPHGLRRAPAAPLP